MVSCVPHYIVSILLSKDLPTTLAGVYYGNCNNTRIHIRSHCFFCLVPTYKLLNKSAKQPKSDLGFVQNYLRLHSTFNLTFTTKNDTAASIMSSKF